jgi:hypothetical protein
VREVERARDLGDGGGLERGAVGELDRAVAADRALAGELDFGGLAPILIVSLL